MNSGNDSQKNLKRFIVIAAALLGLVLVVLFATGKLDDFLDLNGEVPVSGVQSVDGSSISSGSGGSSESSDVNSVESSAGNSSDGSLINSGSGSLPESSEVSGAESSVNNSSGGSTGSSDNSANSPGDTSELRFRNSKLLEQHYQKHGIDMGFSSAEEYEKAAAAVPKNPNALHKTEAEDGDDVYYIESTNEFVVVSTDGFLRTYFNPDRGIDYFNRQ